MQTLSSGAIAVLGQLWKCGPTWDGNIISKAARGELVKAGLAFHAHGYASLTPDGVLLASTSLDPKD
jgi:hypothetical protein